PREAITHDYLQTNATFDVTRRRRALKARMTELMDDEPGEELVDAMMFVRAEYLAAAFAAMEEGWGSVDGYLRRAAGLDDGEREQVRAALLEDGWAFSCPSSRQ